MMQNNHRVIRITLVISSLAAGGAERVMSHMANYWVKKGWMVTLITLSKSDNDFFKVESKVIRVSVDMACKSMNLIHAIKNNFQRILALRREIRKSSPDAVISFTDRTNVLVLLATIFTSMPVFATEHIDPRRHKIGRSWRLLRSIIYPQSAALIVLTKSVLPWAVKKVGEKKAHVIPNSITLNQNILIGNQREFPRPYIVSVGRLEEQKGFDYLLRSFKPVSDNHPDWTLVILGEGSERGYLESIIQELELNKSVCMPGRHSNPMSVMEQAELYVMSSRYEGFPIVLLEALASGLPVISFDCHSGPGDVLRDDVDGVLVPAGDIQALTVSINKLISDPAKRNAMRLRTREVLERFGEDKIMTIWEDLIYKNLIKNKVVI